MYVDIADMRPRPWVALSHHGTSGHSRASLAGELSSTANGSPRRSTSPGHRHEYFRERQSLTRDLLWAVSEFEELEHCEVAGAAVFVAFAEGHARDDSLVQTVTNSLLDQLALIYQHAIEAMPNASLQLPFEHESQRGPADAHPNTGLHTTPRCLTKAHEQQAPDRPETGPIDAAADDPRDRGLALLHAAAVKGRANVCPRGAAPFVIEVPDANVSRSRSYRGTLKVEGHVDGLRWHNLAFSVHGAPVPNAGGSDDLNSGKRFFSGKVDARIFLKLLPHFIDRSICVFELHEFVDPLGIPGKGSTYEMSSFEFVRKPDTGLFVEE
jgi:hypothetical protein